MKVLHYTNFGIPRRRRQYRPSSRYVRPLFGVQTPVVCPDPVGMSKLNRDYAFLGWIARLGLR